MTWWISSRVAGRYLLTSLLEIETKHNSLFYFNGVENMYQPTLAVISSLLV